MKGKKLLAALLAFAMIFSIMPTFSAAASEEDNSKNSIVVTTAEDLRNAVVNATDGDVIVMGADITYDVNDEGFGTLTIAGNITLDFGGYTLRTAGGENANEKFIYIATTGKLTLVNAQVETGSFGIGYLGDFITENRGSLIVKSTGEAGIKAYYLVYYNYGTVEICDGRLDVEYVVEYSYENSSVTVSNATITCGSEFIYDAENSTVIVTNCEVSCDDFFGYITGGSLTINGGTYTCDGDISDSAENASITFNGGTFDSYCTIDEASDCTITVEDGKFTAESYAFDDLKGCTVVFKKGSINAYNACFYVDSNGTSAITIYEGNFESTSNRAISNYATSGVAPTTVNIYDGNFLTHDYAVLCNEGVMNIYGGSFEARNDGSETADYSAIDNYSNLTLSGGTFFTGGGVEAICLDEESATLTIADGYKAIPADWEATKAEKVEIVPIIVTITYISEGATYKEISAAISEQTLPENPTHSGGYDFLFWETENGERVDNISEIVENTTLYAVFSDRTYTVTFIDKGTSTTQSVQIGTPLGKVAGLDRKNNGDGFLCWKMNGSTVGSDTTEEVNSNLTLAAVYAGMVMNYNELTKAVKNKQNVILGADIIVEGTVIIDYDCVLDGNTFGLIRPEGFKGALLTTKQGVTGGEETGGITTTDTTLTARNLLIDGKNLDSWGSAIFVSEDTTLVMENVTIQNNNTNLTDWEYFENDFYSKGYGGAIYIEKNAVVSLTDCAIKNNSADSGGGIYAAIEWGAVYDDMITLTMKNCAVTGNAASAPYSGNGGGIYFSGSGNVTIIGGEIQKNTATRYGGGLSLENMSRNNKNFGATITNTIIAENEATYGGALDYTISKVDLYGTTSLEHNKAKRGGACDSNNGGDADDTILTMHDSSSMSYNEATEDGGALYAWEQTLVMNDNSSLHHNTAGKDGGAVYMGGNYIIQNGGVIRNNHAEGCGGGVYNRENDSAFNGGMIYDNTAGKAGDDLYSARCWLTLYATQPGRNLEDGNSTELGTVQIEPIEGYYDADLTDIVVPWYGWFIDGKEDYVYKEVEVYKSGKGWVKEWRWVYNNTWSEDTRYKDVYSSVIVSNENGNTNFLGGEDGLIDIGGKAIWYGLLLAYDANYSGSAAYEYDSNAYLPSSEASVRESMFERAGYRFIGWNTQSDGSGTAYAPDDPIVMEKSQVLYAQWEKLYFVKYEISGDPTYGIPADTTLPTDVWYAFEETVFVLPEQTTAWTTSDGTTAGVPGTWSFTSWDKEGSFLITSDTTIRGAWSFTPSQEPIKPPQTGDSSNIGLWLSLMLISLTTFFGTCIYRQRHCYIGNHKKRG